MKGEIPANIILETQTMIAFTDLNPLSVGHCLFIPREHGERLHDLSDNAISEILRSIKMIAKLMQIENYNILQNNGAIAHQAVSHVHFHLIPKPDSNQGLGIVWSSMGMDVAKQRQENFANEVIDKLR